MLYVFLQTTRNVPYGLDFEVVGSAMASVANYDAEPHEWVKRYTVISNTNVSIVGQTAIHRTGPAGNPHPPDPRGAEYVYSHMFVSPRGAASTTVLMRFPLARLPEVGKEAGWWEYWTVKGVWLPWGSTDPMQPPPGAATYWGEIGTVRWREVEREWINVAPSPQCFFGGGGVYSTSPNLTEGWTAYEELYQTSETDRTSPRYLKDAWCYTGQQALTHDLLLLLSLLDGAPFVVIADRSSLYVCGCVGAEVEHPEFERAGELVFTYVCNGHSLDTVLTNNSIYEPQLVRMPYPNHTRKAGRVESGVQMTQLPSTAQQLQAE